MSERDGSRLLWFLGGLGIGAIVGVLYAPRSGAETREAIRAHAEDGQEYLRTRAKDARVHPEEWVDRGREVLNQQKEQIRSASDAFRQAYRDTTKPEADVTKNL